MKQQADKYTRDAFDTPKRGRPSKPDAKTPAQRAKAYGARKKANQVYLDQIAERHRHFDSAN